MQLYEFKHKHLTLQKIVYYIYPNARIYKKADTITSIGFLLLLALCKFNLMKKARLSDQSNRNLCREPPKLVKLASGNPESLSRNVANREKPTLLLASAFF